MEHNYTQIFSIEDPDDEFVLMEENERGSDELLIDAIRGYPHLYNPALKEYKDIHKKENSWREVASVMNMSVASCQNRCLRLRERFTKEQRLQEIETRSGSKASHRSIFNLYNNMLFLKYHIKRRKSFSNVNMPANKIFNSGNRHPVSNNFSLNNISCDTHMSDSNQPSSDSNQSLSSASLHNNSLIDNDASIDQLEMARSRHFSRIPQEINNIQSQQIQLDDTSRSSKLRDGQADHIHIPQEINTYDEMQRMHEDTIVHNRISQEKNELNISPLPRNESCNSEASSISNESVLSSAT